MVEIWDLYDENYTLLNKKHIRGVPIPIGEYHIVVNVWIINKDGKILLTKRHPDKPFGLLWECTGGSVIEGEDSVIGALRELNEEVGLKVKAEDLVPIHNIRLSDRFVDTYITIQDIKLENLILQAEEVIDAKLVSIEELNHMWKKGEVVPKERYKMYQKELMGYITKTIENNESDLRTGSKE